MWSAYIVWLGRQLRMSSFVWLLGMPCVCNGNDEQLLFYLVYVSLSFVILYWIGQRSILVPHQPLVPVQRKRMPVLKRQHFEFISISSNLFHSNIQILTTRAIKTPMNTNEIFILIFFFSIFVFPQRIESYDCRCDFF